MHLLDLKFIQEEVIIDAAVINYKTNLIDVNSAVIIRWNLIWLWHHSATILDNYNLEQNIATGVRSNKGLDILTDTKLSFVQTVNILVNKSHKQSGS